MIRRRKTPIRPPAPRRSHVRHGASLLEMLVTITIAGAMMGLMGTLLHRLLQAENDATYMARYSASITRLSRAFRADLHAAREIQIDGQPEAESQTLVARLADGHEVQYELARHVATRIETTGGAVVHRDQFHVPLKSKMEFHRREPARVSLAIHWDNSLPKTLIGGLSRNLMIVATLGRDHRFEKSASAGGAP